MKTVHQNNEFKKTTLEIPHLNGKSSFINGTGQMTRMAVMPLHSEKFLNLQNHKLQDLDNLHYSSCTKFV